MIVIDILYVLGRPLAYLSSALGIRRIIQTKTTKSFSLLAWSIATLMVLATFIRSFFSLHDLIFWLNGVIGLCFSFTELFLIWKWRKQ